MKKIVWFISFLGLALTLFPSIFVFIGTIEIDINKKLMFLGTLLWFISAPFRMKKKISE